MTQTFPPRAGAVAGMLERARERTFRRSRRGRSPLAERLLAPLRDEADRGAQAPPRSEASLAHYDALLEAEAQVADVPVDLLKALCWYASGWRQFEPSGRVLTLPTPQGTCYGCMQLNDVWHPDAFPAALTDAQASIRYAATLLRWLHEQTGDWHRATVAFFGHDRRAENAARRVRTYATRRPWRSRQATVSGDEVQRAAN